MTRVLHLMRSLNAGGIGTFILNIYRTLDREKIQFDFAITHGGMGEYGMEIREKGGEIFFISTEGNRNFFDGVKQVFNFYKLCKSNNYDAVHCHYYFANAYFLLAAKMAGVKIRVSHCHNTRTKEIGLIRKIFEFVSRAILLKTGTTFLGCADEPTKFLYGEEAFASGKAQTLYNGIDYDYWDLNKVDISVVKNDLGLSTEKVLLFVGRMEEQKNPIYALQVVNDLHKRISNIRFYIVGEGSLLQQCKLFVKNNNMESYTVFLPADSDIRNLQAISDVMVAPSLWEGLSIAYIEAQKMGTMVFSSDQVPYEVDMGYCRHYSLSDREKWVNEIFNYLIGVRRDLELVNPQRFDVRETARNLLCKYIN